MTVASLRLCRTLYELSGWRGNTYWYDRSCDCEEISVFDSIYVSPNGSDIPAYDLGFLLRKLPPNFHTGDVRGAFEFFLKTTGREWFAGYNKPEMGKWLYDNNHGVWERPCTADIPENALCKLCIELFNQGVLKPESEG